MAQELQSSSNKLNIPRSAVKYSSQQDIVNVAKCQLFQWLEVQKIPSPGRSRMYVETIQKQYPSLKFTDEMYSEWLSEVAAVYRSKYPEPKADEEDDAKHEDQTQAVDSNQVSNDSENTNESNDSDPKWLSLQNGVIGDLLLQKYKINALSLEDRCLGCLLGVMLIDALGAPYEGHPYESIAERLNPKGVIHMVPGTHMGAREKGPRCGYYTDDTMTTLALGLSIVENQQLLAQHAADNYYKFWKTNPIYRGLPDSAQKVLNDVHNGMSITITGRQSFPDGSFANGGAMRISPIGLVYRNANHSVLRDAVVDAVLSSHCHSQSIDGALAMALSVQYALKFGDGNQVDSEVNHKEFVKLILDNMQSEEMKQAMQAVSDGFEGFLKLQSDTEDTLDTDGIMEYDVQFLEKMGWLTFQIKAIEAVPFVLYCTLRWYRNPEQCAINVVNLGGDNDTTGAMAGAILGAMYGTRWIPKRWYENMENTWKEAEDTENGDDDENKEDGTQTSELDVCTDAYGLDLALFLGIELAKLDFKEHIKFKETKTVEKSSVMGAVLSKLKGIVPNKSEQ